MRSTTSSVRPIGPSCARRTWENSARLPATHWPTKLRTTAGRPRRAQRRSSNARCCKGVPTVIADLRGPEHVVASGNPGLATGGSGDMLAGFIGAFLARGTAPAEAAALGAHALGRAAESGARQWTARSLRPADVLAALPDVWRAWKEVRPARPPVLAALDAPEL